jgi:hypothetical protein
MSHACDAGESGKSFRVKLLIAASLRVMLQERSHYVILK